MKSGNRESPDRQGKWKQDGQGAEKRKSGNREIGNGGQVRGAEGGKDEVRGMNYEKKNQESPDGACNPRPET
jgi:hypothetical protein